MSTDNLQKSEKTYRTLCHNIPGMVYRGRSDWSTEIISNCEAVCGYSPQDINSNKLKWLEIIHPDDRERILNEASKLEDKPLSIIQEYRIINKDGSVRFVEDHKTSTFTEKGVFGGIDGVVFDITERKLAEEQLRKTQSRLEFILATTPATIYTCRVGGDWGATFISKNIKNQFGFEPEKFVGDSEFWLSHIHPDDRVQVTTGLSKLSYQDYHNQEYRFLHKDGSYRWVYDEFMLRRDEQGVPFEGIGYLIDITEQKQLETERKIYKEKVLEAQKHAYIGTMGAIVAHQLNQPLTTINMRLGKALEISKEKENRHHEVLNNIEKSLSEAKKAASIIQKFRQYSKSSALEGTGKINVSLIADRIISVLSEIAMRAKMRVSTKGLRDLPDVDANEIALEQIFLIIIQNAIEATDGQKPHKLDITGKVIDDNIELQFADDCCGIKPENLEMIFEPFFSTKTEDKRLGLGLDIVQQILISCGGRIRVESQLGKGTTFYVTLPTSNI